MIVFGRSLVRINIRSDEIAEVSQIQHRGLSKNNSLLPLFTGARKGIRMLHGSQHLYVAARWISLMPVNLRSS